MAALQRGRRGHLVPASVAWERRKDTATAPIPRPAMEGRRAQAPGNRSSHVTVDCAQTNHRVRHNMKVSGGLRAIENQLRGHHGNTLFCRAATSILSQRLLHN